MRTLERRLDKKKPQVLTFCEALHYVHVYSHTGFLTAKLNLVIFNGEGANMSIVYWVLISTWGDSDTSLTALVNAAMLDVYYLHSVTP